MIVPRFTFFTENFVIRCDQVTNMFRSGHDCTNASSARGPCYFGLQAYFTILDPSESAFIHCAYPNPVPRMLAATLEVHETNWKCRHFCIKSHQSSSEVLLSTKFSLNSRSQSGNSCDISLCTSSDSPFFVSVVSCNGSPRSSPLDWIVSVSVDIKHGIL